MEKTSKGRCGCHSIPVFGLSRFQKASCACACFIEGRRSDSLPKSPADPFRTKMQSPIESGDFAKGGLNLPSNIRPNRLFTADRSIVLTVAGQVRTDVFAKAVDAVVAILRS